MAFNPYYDKKDRALIDAWQNLTNFKFNFSDPNGEQQIINILFLTKGFLIMTLLEQTLLTQLEEKEKMGARYGDVIRATIDGIQDIKREISQYGDRINKQYKFLISRVVKIASATNELAERIKGSDVFVRKIPDTTREFEEVARKYALSHAQKDVKIDVNGAKKRDIGGMGFDF